MRLGDCIKPEQKKKLMSINKKPPNKEEFTPWELEEMMGIRRDTYKRVNGAVRKR